MATKIEGLTDAQTEALRCFRKGAKFTVPRLADELLVSPQQARQHVRNLERLGFVEKTGKVEGRTVEFRRVK